MKNYSSGEMMQYISLRSEAWVYGDGGDWDAGSASLPAQLQVPWIQKSPLHPCSPWGSGVLWGAGAPSSFGHFVSIFPYFDAPQ
jgi:hypothetical protein